MIIKYATWQSDTIGTYNVIFHNSYQMKKKCSKIIYYLLYYFAKISETYTSIHLIL